jgi:hypothetical protein
MIQVYDGDGEDPDAMRMATIAGSPVARVCIGGLTMPLGVKDIQSQSGNILVEIQGKIEHPGALNLADENVLVALSDGYRKARERTQTPRDYKFTMMINSIRYDGCFVTSEDHMTDTDGNHYVRYLVSADSYCHV